VSDPSDPVVRLLRLDAERMPPAAVPSADIILLRVKWRRRRVRAMRITRVLQMMDYAVGAVAIALLAMMVVKAWQDVWVFPL
jgi:hypothetical protein